MQRVGFVPMNWTDNPKLACRNDDIINGLGTITLHLCKGKIICTAPNPSYYPGPVDQSPIHRAHEAELDMTERTA